MCSAKQGQDITADEFHGLDSVGNFVQFAHSGRVQGKGIVIVDEEAVKLQWHARVQS